MTATSLAAHARRNRNRADLLRRVPGLGTVEEALEAEARTDADGRAWKLGVRQCDEECPGFDDLLCARPQGHAGSHAIGGHDWSEDCA